MKQLLNWRQWVLHALFTVGVLAFMGASGEAVCEMSGTQWTLIFILYIAVGIACFFTIHKLTKKWEREGKIKSPTINRR